MIRFKRYIVLVILLLIASLVRLWHIESVPAWYTDEGTHIEIARHLINGEVQYLGITDSYLIAARLPLFENLLALWFRCMGIGMFQLRVLTSLLGIVAVALVYQVVKVATHDRLLALNTLGLLAMYPQAVIYSRFGFSYNLLPIILLSGLWFLLRFYQLQKLKYLIISSLIFGLGTLSDFIGFSFLPSVILIVFFTQRKYILPTVIGLLLPFILYNLAELSYHPDIFLHDLTYTLSRTGGLPLRLQVENLVKNFQVLLTETWWMPLGMLGSLFIPKRYFHWMMILLIIPPILISGRTVALYNLSAYYMIPFLPFVAIGVAFLLMFISKRVNRFLKIQHQISLYVMVGAIMILSGVQLWTGIQNEFVLGIEQFLIDEDEAKQIYDVLIDYTKPSDLVIASPTVAWMFDTQVTDYQLSSLSTQIDGVHFPANLYPDRFAFEVDYHHATYAIVDNLWRDWGAVHMPMINDMLKDIQQNWELIFQTHSLQVYKNPQT